MDHNPSQIVRCIDSVALTRLQLGMNGMKQEDLIEQEVLDSIDDVKFDPKRIMSCPSCGRKISINAERCPRCGELFVTKRKSRFVYILLAIFFGFLGFHKFYSGHILSGLLTLIFFPILIVLTLTMLWPIIFFIIDAFFILIDILFTKKDAHGVPFSDEV